MIKSDKDFISEAESDFLATGVVRVSPCYQDIGEPGSPVPALEALLGSRPPGQASDFPNKRPAFPPGSTPHSSSSSFHSQGGRCPSRGTGCLLQPPFSVHFLGDLECTGPK